jgi:hypothetical protein
MYFMQKKPSLSLILLILIFSFPKKNSAQLPFNLVDGRQHRYCESCTQLLDEAPPEVMFGFQINDNGEIYFSMSNINWFNKILKNDSYGITVDLVSKDRYKCNTSTPEFSLPKGKMLAPVYRKDLLKNNTELRSGHIFTKIGNLPAALKNKDIEGNLVIVNGNYICHYTNFLDIDRSAWKLLPMGLFTDSLVNDQPEENSGNSFFTYSKKIPLMLPFAKSSVTFSQEELKKVADSLSLKNYRIQRIELRAYSSVEGPEKTNNDLMKKRGDAVLSALKAYSSGNSTTSLLTAENWLEFFRDIEDTKFSELGSLSKTLIKQKLTSPALAREIEPLLAKERKVIATLFVEERSASVTTSADSLLGNFNEAIRSKNIKQARNIQKALVERVTDKQIPEDYLNKLEIPEEKSFASLLNDREVYKYLLKATSEYEALDNFLTLKKLDPTNGRINYNICALQFFMWQFGGDTLIQKTLLKDLNLLISQGIDQSLVKRLLINYHILKSETQMDKLDYAAKDSSLDVILELYRQVDLSDDEIYSLAKYYTAYSHNEWAEEIIASRVDKIDASENLVFYYINLLFFQPGTYDSEGFQKAVLNAINLNRPRFCRFFSPTNKGGAGMQLLDREILKSLYCENCK